MEQKLEFLLINDPANEKIISNYRTFHELNRSVLMQIDSLDKDVEAILNRNKSHQNLAKQYQELHSTFESLIECAKHLSRSNADEESEDSIYGGIENDYSRFECFEWYEKIMNYEFALKKLDKELKPTIEQIQFYCKMGYQEPITDSRGESKGQTNSTLEKHYKKFKKILLWDKDKKTEYSSTFEGLLREIHSRYYRHFNTVVVGDESTHDICIGGPIVVPYFTSTGIVNPKMQEIIDAINNLDELNKKNNIQKNWMGFGIEREVETAMIHTLEGRYFTDETFSLSIKPLLSKDHRIYVELVHDTANNKYRISYDIGTKDNISKKDSEIHHEVFSAEGWSFNKKHWSEKDLMANIIVEEDKLERTLVTTFVLSELVANNLKQRNLTNGEEVLKYLGEFHSNYKSEKKAS